MTKRADTVLAETLAYLPADATPEQRAAAEERVKGTFVYQMAVLCDAINATAETSRQSLQRLLRRQP